MHSTPSAKLLWSNRSNPGTTLAASGNSGNTPIDLRYVNSLWLAVSVTAATGTNPILDVYLDLQDAAGNWLTQILHATPQLTGAGSASGSAGLHLPSGTGLTPVVLPEYGRISWTVGGTATPTFTGTVVSLYGR